MRRLTVLLVVITFACSADPTPHTTTDGPGSHSRVGSLHNLVKIVDVRDSPAASFLAASEGDTMLEHGEVRTGSASTARLDLGAGGMVRLGPQTSLGIELLGGTDSDPLTRLTFVEGQLWVSLSRGQLEALTPLGVAAVRGSYAELQYNQGTDSNSVKDDVLTINCIEGICTFDGGTGPITIGTLQQLVIRNGGKTLTGPTALPASAVTDFLANNPESIAVVLTLTAIPSATTAPSATQVSGGLTAAPSASPLPAATATGTSAPTSTDTPRPTPTRTRRPPPIVPSDTPSDTPAPSDTPVPSATATDIAKPPPPPPPPAPTSTPVSPTTAPSATPAPTDTPPPTQTPNLVPPPTKTPSRTPP